MRTNKPLVFLRKGRKAASQAGSLPGHTFLSSVLISENGSHYYASSIVGNTQRKSRTAGLELCDLGNSTTIHSFIHSFKKKTCYIFPLLSGCLGIIHVSG